MKKVTSSAETAPSSKGEGKRTKVYAISDLFYTDWQQLSCRQQAFVYARYQLMRQTQKGTKDYGLHLIAILRALRKNKRAVARMNEEQAVDIFNDLHHVLLKKPWYYFPKMKGWRRPVEYMAMATFDQFIFADHEFTSYMATEDANYLKRLAATLYLHGSADNFKKEFVDKYSGTIKGSEGQLMVIDSRPPIRFKVHELELLFFSYVHVREFVIKRCKNLLPASPQPSPAEMEKPRPSGPMWHEIKHEAARTGVFGTFEELGKANMYDVLDHLEILAKKKEHAHA